MRLHVHRPRPAGGQDSGSLCRDLGTYEVSEPKFKEEQPLLLSTDWNPAQGPQRIACHPFRGSSLEEQETHRQQPACRPSRRGSLTLTDTVSSLTVLRTFWVVLFYPKWAFPGFLDAHQHLDPELSPPSPSAPICGPASLGLRCRWPLLAVSVSPPAPRSSLIHSPQPRRNCRLGNPNANWMPGPVSTSHQS